MRRLGRAALVAALLGAGGPGTAAPAGAGEAPGAPAPGAGRVLTFAWTLYPRMWAELDLRVAAGAVAVAEVTAEGGEVSWNLHAHPPGAPPAAFVVLAQGVAARATVRCAPDTPGLYSYLFGNDGQRGPVRVRIELTLTGDVRLEAVKP